MIGEVGETFQLVANSSVQNVEWELFIILSDMMNLIQKLGVRLVNKSRRDILDSLVVSYGKSAGRVIRTSSHKGYHFSASKGGVYVSLGHNAFDRLVKLGKINGGGVPV